jgi:hypothetical protein
MEAMDPMKKKQAPNKKTNSSNQRGQTAPDRNAQDPRIAAARRERARIVRGDISNAGDVGHGQRGVSGVNRQPESERPKK